MRNETREQKFKRLAEARTNRILHILQLLGNLASKSTYNYDKAQVSKIFKAIEEGTDIAKARFSSIRSSFFTLEPKIKKEKKLKVEKEVKETIKQTIKIDRCDNCFENRPTQLYRGLNLCKRDFRKRKLIYKVRKANGNKRSFIK